MMRCPKCHQPLEDQDEGLYICCAEAPIEWQCQECGKISEGFAFPYGACPQCGGRLDLRTAGSAVQTAEAATMNAVRTAFEIELGGRAFYQRAAAECEDETLRALFGRFAVMEGEHMETLSRRYHVGVPTPSEEFSLRTAAVYADAEPPQNAADLFKLAIALEKRAVAFFSARAATVVPDSPEHQLYQELAAEEREHAQLLTAEFARWRGQLPGLFGGEVATMAARTAAPGTDTAMNAAEVLLAGHDANIIALECGDERITYGQLRDRVARAAAVWKARGLRPGDRVAVKLNDGIDWVVCWLGTIWAGGVAVGVNPRIPAPEWEYILDEAGFNVIVAESSEDTPAPWRDRVITLEEGQRAVAAAAVEAPVQMNEDSPMFWVHSSGTSGRPKAVVHAHRCVRESGRISAERIGMRPGDRLFASSKLFFAYPLANLLLGGLRNGATLILDPTWPTPQIVAEAVIRTRPNILFSVPSLYRYMLHEGLASQVTAAGVRCCVSAGEALPASLRQAWSKATGLPMIDGYGASEVLVLVMTEVEGEDGLHPSPGTIITPLDPEAAEAGGPTRLLICSPMQALGYLDRPAAQADSFRQGCFCPADLFSRTPGGGWRFGGREDSLVKIKGRWVNLVELEERLGANVPGLREAAVVCAPDAHGIDEVGLFYSGSDDGSALRELEARIAALPKYQRPAWLRPIDALPRTATGKLLRRALVEHALYTS
jgi:acyl-coenzyme A synthetase/AMP-(fatty) acid ligase/rubrerythrin